MSQQGINRAYKRITTTSYKHLTPPQKRLVKAMEQIAQNNLDMRIIGRSLIAQYGVGWRRSEQAKQDTDYKLFMQLNYDNLKLSEKVSRLEKKYSLSRDNVMDFHTQMNRARGYGGSFLMKTMLLILLLSGIASQYAPGKMQEVIHTRQIVSTSHPLPTQLPQVDGYIAVADPSLIGEQLLVCPEQLPCRLMLVVDCAGIQDGGLSWMNSNGIVLEMDYASAVAWNTVGRGLKVNVYRRQYVRHYEPQ